MTAKSFVIAVVSLILFVHVTFSSTPITAQADECSPSKPAVDTGSARYTLVSGDIEREYIVFVPSGYDPAQPTAIVLSFHGYTSNAAEQQIYTGWNTVAEHGNFIVVYPQATGEPTRWFAYEDGNTYTGRPTTDDVQFVRDLIERLGEDYCVDPSRIYVNGLSNGGGMTHRLACELTDQIAAVGMVAGAFVENQSCDPARPIPVMAFHGTDDETVPYNGRGYFPPIEEWTAAWAQRDGCDPTPEALPTHGDVSGIAYMDCDDGAEVILYTIDGGRHVWPGASPLFDAIVGVTTQDIDATETMWDFFVEHPLN